MDHLSIGGGVIRTIRKWIKRQAIVTNFKCDGRSNFSCKSRLNAPRHEFTLNGQNSTSGVPSTGSRPDGKWTDAPLQINSSRVCPSQFERPSRLENSRATRSPIRKNNSSMIQSNSTQKCLFEFESSLHSSTRIAPPENVALQPASQN